MTWCWVLHFSDAQREYWQSVGEKFKIVQKWLVFSDGHKLCAFGNCQRCGWRKP